MFATILVPLDGSALAERAIPYAEALARSCGARVALVRAATAGITGSRVTVTHEALAYLDKLAAGLRTGGLAVETSAPYAAPTAGVLAEVRRVGADLIVMASHGRSGLGHLAYGSIAEEILSRAPVPVLLVGTHPTAAATILPEGEPRLLVPLDGLTQAEDAIGPAHDLATALGASVVLVQVVEPPAAAGPAAMPYGSAAPRTPEDEAQVYLHAVAAQEFPDVATMCVVRTGSPAAVIGAICRDYRATMVVMATHGRQTVGRFFFGSVAADALHEAGIPFLLIGPSVEVGPYGEESALSKTTGG